MEKLLENYENRVSKVNKTVVVFESLSASLYISLLEWLHSSDIKGSIRFKMYLFIWECSSGDLAEFSPTVFYRSIILQLDAPRLYTHSEFAVHIAQGLFEKSRVLIRTILVAMDPILKAFLEKYVQLQNFENHGYTRTCLTKNVLKLVRDMYYNCGGNHKQHFNEQYVGNDANNVLRSPASIRRIIIFSCIWTIGTLPSWGGRKNFSLWFATHFNVTQQDEPSIFPPFHDPFAYILRFDPDDVNELCWAYCYGSQVVNYTENAGDNDIKVKVTSGDTFQKSCNHVDGDVIPKYIPWRFPVEECLSHVYYDRTFRHNSRFVSSVEYMPTKESVALQLIQRIFLHNGGVICLSGEPGSGKSALQRFLLMDETLKRRWVCGIGGKSASNLPEFIDVARKENAKNMMESEQFEAGAIFIDDVSLPCELDSFRYIIENSHYVANNQLVCPLPFMYGVVSVNDGEVDISSFGRFMTYCVNVHLEDSNLDSVFTTMLGHSCVNIQADICLEMIAVSKQIFKEISKLHPILDNEQDHSNDPEGTLNCSLIFFLVISTFFVTFLRIIIIETSVCACVYV